MAEVPTEGAQGAGSGRTGAFLARGRRSSRVVLWERRATGVMRLLVVEVDHLGRGVLDAAFRPDLDFGSLSRALRVLASGMREEFRKVPRTEALTVVARGLLAGRIAGSRVPVEVQAARELLPDFAEVLAATCDAFVCVRCGHPLPPGLQARILDLCAAGVEAVMLRCGACGGSGGEDDGRGDLYRGLVLAAAGEHHHALYHLDRAADRFPDDGEILRARGKVLSALGRSDEAVVALRRSVRLCAFTTPMDRCELGIAELAAGNADLAAGALSFALNPAPLRPEFR